MTFMVLVFFVNALCFFLFKHFGLQLEESRMQKGPKMKKDSPRIKNIWL